MNCVGSFYLLKEGFFSYISERNLKLLLLSLDEKRPTFMFGDRFLNNNKNLLVYITITYLDTKKIDFQSIDHKGKIRKHRIISHDKDSSMTKIINAHITYVKNLIPHMVLQDDIEHIEL